MNDKDMLDMYQSEAVDGTLWQSPETGDILVHHDGEWVTAVPATLEDMDENSPPLEFYEADTKAMLMMEEVEATPFLTIQNENETIVEINVEDGTVTFGESYNPEEAARIFWESLAAFSPWKLPGTTEPMSEEDYKNELELQNQYAAMQSSEDMLLFEEQENGEVYSRMNPNYDWDNEPSPFAKIEDDVEATVDPFDAARGVIE